jgi:hypothetical protein
MRMTVDTTGFTFLLVDEVRPVRDFETKQAKADRDGVPLFQLRLVAMSPGDAEIISVKVAGEPEGLTVGGPVTVEGLTVQPYTLKGRDGQERSGVAFRAERVRDGARAHAAVRGREQGGS